ncbi:5-dehydro-2-deoxygluconokinase [Streptomyces roseoverticillatus]|uniref:5-dehydro-2-deoxygluconokinase n=1 Tax=Streptomyces roseoverticillatus TaxID=66429 RepID=UPI00099752AB|nr:5-dehydro-2-deoxygluconokinase [Streptomyces roseoverticillatus]
MSHPSARTSFDLITMGRVGVDLYPLRTGVPLAEAEIFGKFLGGSPANVAVAAARLGRSAALISRTGADPFGDYLHDALRRFGVDDRWVTPVAVYQTPLTFCEIFPPDDFPLYFYRRPKAPDLEIHADELDLGAIRAARIFWATGTGLCEEPSRTATLAALAARGRRGVTVLDLDWRPLFWGGEGGASGHGGRTGPAAMAAARPHYAAALAHATVAVGNADECEVATGERAPWRAARALLDAGAELAVVKRGPEGVLAVHRDGTTAEVPPVEVDVVNGLGAGDAFGGALCHGLLAGRPLEQTLRFANAAGALVASRLSCSEAMPTRQEVEALLTRGSGAAGAAGRSGAARSSPEDRAGAARVRPAGGAGEPGEAAHGAHGASGEESGPSGEEARPEVRPS